MNLIGTFQNKSSCSNQHVLVGYDYDGNHINGTPAKKGCAIAGAWK